MIGSPGVAAEMLCLSTHGAQLFPAALDVGALADLLSVLRDQPSDRAGVRLFQTPGLASFLGADGPVGAGNLRSW